MVQQGKIGRVHTVEMQVWTGDVVPHESACPVPAGWDYDQWLGPVPWRPFVPARVNAWTCFWDTGEGMHTIERITPTKYNGSGHGTPDRWNLIRSGLAGSAGS